MFNKQELTDYIVKWARIKWPEIELYTRAGIEKGVGEMYELTKTGDNSAAARQAAHDMSLTVNITDTVRNVILDEIVEYTKDVDSVELEKIARNKVSVLTRKALIAGVWDQKTIVEIRCDDGTGYRVDCSVKGCEKCNRGEDDYAYDHNDTSVSGIVWGTVYRLGDSFYKSVELLVEDGITFDSCDCDDIPLTDDELADMERNKVTLKRGTYTARSITREDANPDFKDAIVLDIPAIECWQ